MNFKIDLSQLRNIDFNDVARWPKAAKIIAIGLISACVLGAGLWFDTRTQLDQLQSARDKENALKAQFVTKQGMAANLDAYKAQLEEMRRSFGAMLRQLPSKTEVAELLVDVSQTGLQNGLQFDLFKPENEKPADFYAELPIKIKVAGTFHEFGRFVSDVAALPRIVMLQDFSIVSSTQNKTGKPQSQNPDALTMEVTAKTYRYLEDDELLKEDK
jgi:type IV pilus assembly protein PilO